MYIKINNQEVYYQKLGQGKDLIMLHGWKQDLSTFHNVTEELKKYFTLWLIDLPGFGRSENLKEDFTISGYANIIREFIQTNKISKPSLLGHSLGGNIAIKLVAENGRLIDKLVLEASSGIRPKKGIGRIIFFILAKIFHYLFPNILSLKDKIRRKFYWKLESDYLNAGNLKNTLVNILSEDLTYYLPKIKNKTLLIWGENDQQVNLKYGKLMYQQILNSRLEIIEDIGHFPHIENPKMFLYYAQDFLS